MNKTLEQDTMISQLTPFYEAWQPFRLSHAKVARWFVPVEHYRWVEAFLEHEATEMGMLPDLFVRFESPFDDPGSYGIDLRNEFRKMVSDDRERLMEEENIELQWKPITPQNLLHNSQYFFEELKEFARINELFEEQLIVYLAPTHISDPSVWSSWLADALQTGIPNPVRVMIIDTHENPVFHTLSSGFPENVTTLTPDFDLDAAMSHIAAGGNSSDPGVRFRKTFVALTQAARRNDWKEIEKLSKEALDIAHQHTWIHLEATVHMVVAGVYLNERRYEEAFKQYEYAYHTALQKYNGVAELEASIHKACELAAIQALFGEANTLIAQKMYLEAADIYLNAAQRAETVQDKHYELEAWRMAGYCYEQGRNYPVAWEANEKALEAGSQLDDETRRGSTLPYVGQALLRLTQRVGRSQQTYEIKDKMIEMVGIDWESNIQTR